VKHVAATHGGEIRVWSVEGEGSTFTLMLPTDEHKEADELEVPVNAEAEQSIAPSALPQEVP
jgi:two-component system sensor histidine kinase SenX3